MNKTLRVWQKGTSWDWWFNLLSAEGPIVMTIKLSWASSNHWRGKVDVFVHIFFLLIWPNKLYIFVSCPSKIKCTNYRRSRCIASRQNSGDCLQKEMKHKYSIPVLCWGQGVKHLDTWLKRLLFHIKCSNWNTKDLPQIALTSSENFSVNPVTFFWENTGSAQVFSIGKEVCSFICRCAFMSPISYDAPVLMSFDHHQWHFERIGYFLKWCLLRSFVFCGKKNGKNSKKCKKGERSQQQLGKHHWRLSPLPTVETNCCNWTQFICRIKRKMKDNWRNDCDMLHTTMRRRFWTMIKCPRQFPCALCPRLVPFGG